MAKQKKLINREMSWLAFNHRVLQEAADPTVPLIERLRFLGIFSNNMDEFFKVRVATVRRMIGLEKYAKEIIGEKPKKLLNRIQERVIDLQKQFEKIYYDILCGLEKENIFLINEKHLSPSHRVFVENYFDENVLPVLSPIMLNQLDQFPSLADKSIYLAVRLTRATTEGSREYALIEIPSQEVSRFLVLPPDEDKKYLMLLDDVIRACLPKLFAIFRYTHMEAYTIKITRDAELDIDNDISKSFLEQISKSVSGRKRGEPVRFVYDKHIPEDLLHYLSRHLGLDSDDNIIPGGRYHNFKDFIEFPNIGGKHLEYHRTPAVSHPDIRPGESLLHLLSKKDLILYFPYQKYAHFIDLLREASIDPEVKTIKVCLYRIGRVSRIANMLINAARNGKDVTVIMELRARFDEKSNIFWSREFEEVGIKVIFGIPNIKVHAKIVQISRKEGKKMMHYAVVSTGNFHDGNAAVYSDLTLFTSDKRISQEVKKVFEFFENTFKRNTYKHLLVSPNFMRRRLLKLIDHEIVNAKMGRPAYIFIKINNIVDTEMIRKLYKASQAGVKIRLMVRGICSLMPGIPGLSENIEIHAVIDKFLEHARVFVFCNNNKELFYISSADWMTRNLDHRVEVAAPIYDPHVKEQVMHYMNIHWYDNVKARIVSPEQDNKYLVDSQPEKIRSQMKVYELIKENKL
jgi:polyphosphate kinase